MYLLIYDEKHDNVNSSLNLGVLSSEQLELARQMIEHINDSFNDRYRQLILSESDKIERLEEE